MPATIPCGAILKPFKVRMVGNRVAALKVPYIRNKWVTVIPGMFATAIPRAKSSTIDNLLCLIVGFLKMSVVRDDIAHKLLSIVDKSPEIIINKNGITAHAGNNVLISSKLSTPKSFAAYPIPAPAKPRMPIDKGTIPKRIAPTKNALPIFFFSTQNALCQKHWSPNGPDIRPTVVGNPNPRKISKPLLEKSEPQSPLIPPRPAITLPKPFPFLIPNTAKQTLAININTI